MSDIEQREGKKALLWFGAQMQGAFKNEVILISSHFNTLLNVL